MDPVTGAIVGKVNEKMTESMFTFMGHQISYVVHCNRNIKKVRVELENLRAEMQTIKGRVDRARDNAEEIEPNVSKWLSDVGDLVKEVDDQFVADKGNLLMCCNGWCPSPRFLGKEAEEKLKIVIMINLDETGKLDSVGHPCPQTHTYLLPDYEHFESRASVFDEIKKALKDDNVYMIGICGMSGPICKTITVDQVSIQAKDMKLFDEVAKFVVSQTPDYRKIQGDIAACLNLKLEKESQAQDASLLCSRLKNGKKILVIIDDVWNPIRLEEIGIPSKDYIKCCKIVSTSRRQDVSIHMDVEKKSKLESCDLEAWSWFKNKVGNTIIDFHHELHPVAKKMCREFGDLPLAIVKLGAVLRNKKLNDWNDTLNQLKNCTGNYIIEMTANVYVYIELSYQFLEHINTKACFLYPEDEEICIEDLVHYGVGRRFLLSQHTMEATRKKV